MTEPTEDECERPDLVRFAAGPPQNLDAFAGRQFYFDLLDNAVYVLGPIKLRLTPT